MDAGRYAGGGFKPGSLGVAVAINGAVLGALLLATPEVIERIAPRSGPTIELIPLPPEEPPPPEPQPKVEQQLPRPRPIDTPDPVIRTEPRLDTYVLPREPVLVDPGTFDGTGTDTGRGPVVIDPPEPPPLAKTAAQIDPRHAGDLQPIYPPSEQRAGREGSVTIRVLIGVNGRVRRAERVAAASDAFWRATEQRALAKWRFRPATEGDVPVESWKTLTIRFVLNE